MSAQTVFRPFSEERMHLAAMLGELGMKLSRLHDASLDGLVSDDFREKMVREMLPDRLLIFKAQQIAYALRLHRPVDDPRDDLPHLFVGNIKNRPGDELDVVMVAECNDIEQAMVVFRQLLTAFHRATVIDG